MIGRQIFRRFWSKIKTKPKLSYASGKSDKPLICDTIGGMLRKQAALHPNNLAQVFYEHDVAYTYEEFDQRVDEIAKGLIGLGLKKGDRVGIYSPNRPEWSLTQYACHRADFILVNVNPAFQTLDLEYALNKVEISALIMPESHSKSSYVDIVRHLIPDLGNDGTTSVNSKVVPHLKHIIVCGHKKHKGMINFDDLYNIYTNNDAKELEIREAEIDFESATNIQFTSGTTGFPKGAALSHHSIINNGLFLGDIMEYTEDSKLLIWVPLYHTMGMVMGNLAALTHGATSVYPCEGFKPNMALKAISKYKCDTAYGVPSMFNGILKEYKDNQEFYNVDSLTKGVIAGSICPEELMKACNNYMGLSFFSIAYGMTETSPISFQVRPTAPYEKKIASVGTIHPFVEAKVADPNGKTVPVNEEGEILVRGYSVMLKYWNDDVKTKETIDELGWVHTGDLGKMDEEGYMEIVGRVKDMIIRGGENIFPKEIENCLLAHPDILDAQVIGVDDDFYGEEIMAQIVLEDPEKIVTRTDIYEFLHGRVAHFKIPKYIKIVTEYPLTVTGKVKKNVMRADANKILKETSPDLWEVDHNIYC